MKPRNVRTFASHASWMAALIAVVVLLAAAPPVDDFAPFVRAGLLLVILATAGLIAGVCGMLLSLRPVRPSLVIPLVGIATNAFLLWSFAPAILCLYF